MNYMTKEALKKWITAVTDVALSAGINPMTPRERELIVDSEKLKALLDSDETIEQ